jgi:hypothetical protein
MAKKISIVLLIMAIACGLWLRFYFSDKEVIKRSFHELAAEISKTEGESTIQMALKMKQVKDKFSSPCQVIIPERSYNNPVEQDLVLRYLIHYRSRYTTIELQFAEMVIQVTSAENATIQTTLHISRRGATEQTANDRQERYPLDLLLVKVEKKWRIQQVTMPRRLLE